MKLDLPSDLAASLRDWGPRWFTDPAAGRDAMVQAWTPHLQLHAADPANSPRITANVPYGPEERQVLDIVRPTKLAPCELPVLMFVHGGAFVRGNKDETPHLYANVAAEFARHDFVAVNVEYRLAPQATWPAAAEDVVRAVRWVASNIRDHGGDRRRIVLMGHSAGSAHCATAVWDERAYGASRLPLKGLVLISPRMEANMRPSNHNAKGVEAYYGPPSVHEDRIPGNKVRADAPPTLVAWSEYENPRLDLEAATLASRLMQATESGGPAPRIIQMMGHNHTSVIAQFNTPFNELGVQIREWMARMEH